jgi:hypothetical protein
LIEIFDEIRNIKSSRRDIRNFGMVVGGALSLLGILLLWWGKPYYMYFVLVGVGLIFLGIAAPTILKPFQKAWMAVAVVLGWFMTRILLGILFYVVFAPIGLVARLLGKRFLELKSDSSQNSYWEHRKTRGFKKEDYERQF